MARVPKELLVEALDLPEEARAQLARSLIASLDEMEEEDPAEIQRAWLAEVSRRAAGIDAGAVSTRPAAEVFRADAGGTSCYPSEPREGWLKEEARSIKSLAPLNSIRRRRLNCVRPPGTMKYARQALATISFVKMRIPLLTVADHGVQNDEELSHARGLALAMIRLVLVTGATGYVGGRLWRRLEEGGIPRPPGR